MDGGEREEIHPVLSAAVEESDEVVIKLTVAPGSPADGKTLGELAARDRDGHVHPRRQPGGRWSYRPRDTYTLWAGDSLLVTGAPRASNPSPSSSAWSWRNRNNGEHSPTRLPPAGPSFLGAARSAGDSPRQLVTPVRRPAAGPQGELERPRDLPPDRGSHPARSTPYRDFFEYPPGSLPAFIPPALFSTDKAGYAALFSSEMALVMVATLVLTALAARRIGELHA